MARRASQDAVERRSWPFRVDNEFALLAWVQPCAGLHVGQEGPVMFGAWWGQAVASVQTPALRVRPWRNRARKLSAAARVCGQASFLVVPR